MSASLPFTRGQNAILKLYQDNKPIYFACKVWDIEENATEVADGVGGENRDRLDKVTNFYTLSVDIYHQDENAMQPLLDAQDVDDAGVLPKNQTGALMLKHRDGTRMAFALQEMKLGPMKVSMQSRSDAIMLNVKARFRYFKRIPSI